MSDVQAGDAHNLFRTRTNPLRYFFEPTAVAVVGATEQPGSVGQAVMRNLTTGSFRGAVFPINPKRETVQGLKCHGRLLDVPDPIDLAIVVTPAKTVPDVVADCVAKAIPTAIVISAGFKEVGEHGKALEQRLAEQTAGGRIRVIGPNCLGLMCPRTGLNATFAGAMARPGSVGFISQSGALCTAILDWAEAEHIGFSAFVSVGSMLDVGWGDLIDYLGDDPHTQSIVIYMESVGEARAFLSAAREVALRKPIIVLKAGRTAAAAQAAASHTGAMTGSDDVLDAAFRRVGVLRVDTIADLFHMAEVLSKQPRPRGPRLTILTNAGGPGVLATDALLAAGGELAPLAPETLQELNTFLPAAWSHANPVDMLGDANHERYQQTLQVLVNEPNSDGLLVILTAQAMSDPTRTAEVLKPFAQTPGRPVLASWMGGPEVAGGVAVLNRVGIPTFAYPDTAVRIFVKMWQRTKRLQALYETPTPTCEPANHTASRTACETLIHHVRHQGRTLLTEAEAKHLLTAHGIPTVVTHVADTADTAVEVANRIGYPVVLKLHSETITHKTDVGGVQLNLTDAAAVRAAFSAIQRGVEAKAGPGHFLGVTVQPMVKLQGYELILGASVDPQFGPIILFGLGGQLVEVFQDRALGLPPLNTTLARRMMEQTRIFTALKGVRGRKPVDIAALEQLVVRFSEMVVEHAWIKEVDINPLIAGPEGLIALDARVVAYAPAEPRTPMAIRPYPTQYRATWTLRDGAEVVIRPIRPEDEPAMIRFHETLSAWTVYLRYYQQLKLSQRIAHERLSRLCFIDYDRELALVVELAGPQGAEIIAIGRLVQRQGLPEGEFSMLVDDRYQRHGLGTELLRRLLGFARDQGWTTVRGEMLPDNLGMQRVCQKLGFTLQYDAAAGVYRAAVAV